MWAQPAVDGGLHPHVHMLLEVDERPAVPDGRHPLAVGGALDGAVDLIAGNSKERLDPPREPPGDRGDAAGGCSGCRCRSLDSSRHDACRPAVVTSAASLPTPART